MSTSKQYEVWWSKGQGSQCGPRFTSLEQALKYVAEHAGQASFAIRQPDDTWYRNANGTVVFSRWHQCAA